MLSKKKQRAVEKNNIFFRKKYFQGLIKLSTLQASYLMFSNINEYYYPITPVVQCN